MRNGSLEFSVVGMAWSRRLPVIDLSGSAFGSSSTSSQTAMEAWKLMLAGPMNIRPYISESFPDVTV